VYRKISFFIMSRATILLGPSRISPVTNFVVLRSSATTATDLPQRPRQQPRRRPPSRASRSGHFRPTHSRSTREYSTSHVLFAVTFMRSFMLLSAGGAFCLTMTQYFLR
jgi:hypothetical protein